MITSNNGTSLTNMVSRSLQQLNDSNGEALPCFATENLWVGYAQRFADPTSKNQVDALTSGKAYFAALIKACSEANNEILIAGWQVNWDALLAPGVRLFDVLLGAAKRGCRVYVMPWNDTAPLQTYDSETEAALEAINGIVGNKLVQVRLENSKADNAATFFAHHQKQVVVDRKIAFIGGIDLAYGRYDDASYNLRANHEGREALNRYNGCIIQTGRLQQNAVVDAADLRKPPQQNDEGEAIRNPAQEAKSKILNGAWQVPLDPYIAYGTPYYDTLDANIQPRMPWQDIQLKVTGAAAMDLTRNFVYRWNTLVSGKEQLAVPPIPRFEGTGGAHVQVLRSAPASMRQAEYKSLPKAVRPEEPSGPQNDIERAMEILIDKAQHFIYIENQFFVSNFGMQNDVPRDFTGPASQINKKDGTGAYLTTFMPGDSQTLPKNDICLLLSGRIGRAILDAANPNFHVYITLPVYSEGRLDSGAVATHIHWTMQSLVFGTMSLLNRIRRFIKARELFDKHDPDWSKPLREGNDDYKSVPMERCFKYVTLLNLRNWEKIGDRYVTEQIYVHSKMMIVDDRFAIVGSANINDRSLLGSRDSELAVMVMDTDTVNADLCGDGKQRPTRGFARKLRQEVWRNLFGITSGIRPATELQSAIDKPADPKSWAAIQAVAKKNTQLYEAAFDWIPRNKNPNDKSEKEEQKRSSSIWPRWSIDPLTRQGRTTGHMPFDSEFWTMPQHKSSASNLTQIKGYITLLPIEWTKGENNNIGYHTALVTERKQTSPFESPTNFGQLSTNKRRV